MRTQRRSESLQAEGVHALFEHETGEESEAIHIFATNKQVDKYNVDKLHSSCFNSVSHDAEELFRDAKSGELVKRANQCEVLNTNKSKEKSHSVDTSVSC